MSKVTVHLAADEVYPVFDEQTEPGKDTLSVEIDEYEYELYKAAEQVFWDMQDKFEKAWWTKKHG